MRQTVKFAIEQANSKEAKKRQQSQATKRKTPKFVTRRQAGLVNHSACEVAEMCGFDPIAIMIDVIMTGHLPAMPIPNPHPDNGEGPTIMKETIVSTEERMKTLRDIARYVRPTLSAVQVTGKDGGAVQVATLDVVALMQDPTLVAHAQALSLAATKQRALAPPAPEQPGAEEIIDAETEDVPE